MGVRIKVGGFIDISTVDWYGHLTFMVFAAGCNFRCPYCQNGKLVDPSYGRDVDIEEVKRMVRANMGFIDALGFSGGEPGLQPEPVIELCKWAKSAGLSTFLNTNGTNPRLIAELAGEGAIDYVAISIIAPLSPPDYARVGGISEAAAQAAVDRVRESLRICSELGIPFEARTTIVPGLIDDEESVAAIARELRGCPYILQQYDPSGDILDPRLKSVPPPPRELLIKLARRAKEEGLASVKIRTRERGQEEVP